MKMYTNDDVAKLRRCDLRDSITREALAGFFTQEFAYRYKVNFPALEIDELFIELCEDLPESADLRLRSVHAFIVRQLLAEARERHPRVAFSPTALTTTLKMYLNAAETGVLEKAARIMNAITEALATRH